MHAQPTPPSRNAKFRSGKRRVTPPKKSPLQTAWPAEAKWPMWLKQKFEGEFLSNIERAPLWNDGASFSSRHFCHTRS